MGRGRGGGGGGGGLSTPLYSIHGSRNDVMSIWRLCTLDYRCGGYVLIQHA